VDLDLAKLKDLEFICQLAELSLWSEKDERLLQMIQDCQSLLREEIRRLEGTENERLLWWLN